MPSCPPAALDPVSLPYALNFALPLPCQYHRDYVPLALPELPFIVALLLIFLYLNQENGSKKKWNKLKQRRKQRRKRNRQLKLFLEAKTKKRKRKMNEVACISEPYITKKNQEMAKMKKTKKTKKTNEVPEVSAVSENVLLLTVNGVEKEYKVWSKAFDGVEKFAPKQRFPPTSDDSFLSRADLITKLETPRKTKGNGKTKDKNTITIALLKKFIEKSTRKQLEKFKKTFEELYTVALAEKEEIKGLTATEKKILELEKDLAKLKKKAEKQKAA